MSFYHQKLLWIPSNEKPVLTQGCWISQKLKMTRDHEWAILCMQVHIMKVPRILRHFQLKILTLQLRFLIAKDTMSKDGVTTHLMSKDYAPRWVSPHLVPQDGCHPYLQLEMTENSWNLHIYSIFRFNHFDQIALVTEWERSSRIESQRFEC